MQCEGGGAVDLHGAADEIEIELGNAADAVGDGGGFGQGGGVIGEVGESGPIDFVSERARIAGDTNGVGAQNQEDVGDQARGETDFREEGGSRSVARGGKGINVGVMEGEAETLGALDDDGLLSVKSGIEGGRDIGQIRE